MFAMEMHACFKFYVIVLSIQCIVRQTQQQQADHHHNHKPWPTYSLQNMPQTRFTCHDKILGGYYADPETQCQMFHVCVKVTGGVQDFRFLCPNSTAFDQEAQICANWGDVDCEQSVLYYGSDNFDLYRIGSDLESKRAPLAEEEEATFHLQRAESGDIRRSKETRVDQKLRPDYSTPFIKQHSFKNYNNNDINNNNSKNRNYHNLNDNVDYNVDAKRLSITSATKSYTNKVTTPTTTTANIERYNDESRQELDEIFKGSHSSHFFANRNGGREDDFQELPAKNKENDFNDYSHKFAETSTSGKTRVQPTRGRQRYNKKVETQQQQHRSNGGESLKARSSTVRSPTSATTNAKFTKASHRTSFDDFNQPQPQNNKVPTTITSTTTLTAYHNTPTTTARSKHSKVNRFSISAHDFLTQEIIKPTTYNPGNSLYRIQTTTAKYPAQLTLQQPKAGTEEKHRKQDDKNNNDGHYETLGKVGANAKIVIADQTRRQSPKAILTHPQNSTFVNHEEFAEFSKIKTLDPELLKPAPIFRPPPPDTTISKSSKSEQARPAGNHNELRTRGRGHSSQSTVNYQEPQPFTASPRQRSNSDVGQHHVNQIKPTTDTINLSTKPKPRGFASRGSINYKVSAAKNDNSSPNLDYHDNTGNNAPKKFSTLVPKDQKYPPTTFKPTTYKKAYEINSLYQTQPTQRSNDKGKTVKPNGISTTKTSTITGVPLDPHQNTNEDDGQYHPELYETDFHKNRFNLQRSTTGATTAKATTTTRANSTPNTAKKTNKSNGYNDNNNNNNNYHSNSQSHLKTQQHTFYEKQQEQQQQQKQNYRNGETNSDSIDFSDEDDELFKTAHSLNFGAASINKLRADIFKAEKTSQQYNSQYGLSQSYSNSPKTVGVSYVPTTSSAALSYPTFVPTTVSFGTTLKPFSSLTSERSISTAYSSFGGNSTGTSISTSTTTTTTNTPRSKSVKNKSKNSKLKKFSEKSSSKRPPHADEDTSYDYAYYDSDSLSESPQAYPEYEISEFSKTYRN